MQKRPYERLYIYLLGGVVEAGDEASLGESFIGNWVEDNSSFLFFRTPARDKVDQLLKNRPYLTFLDDYQFTYEEWHGSTAGPVRIDDFVILFPWGDDNAGSGSTRILLDPGVVFGNGLHPTTKDCLRALGLTARSRPFSKVLDLGTGTGILSLASALLGAERVLAIDLNPLCVKTAVRNVRLNSLENTVDVIEAPAEDFLNEPADLLIANIHHAVTASIIENRPFIDRERLILSGLMRTPFREVRAQLSEQGFRIIHEWDYEMTCLGIQKI